MQLKGSVQLKGGPVPLTGPSVAFTGPLFPSRGPFSILLGSVSGRTDFSRIFIFGPPDFFADFVVGFFLLIFVGKSAQKNSPGKSPAKSSKFHTTRILRHISADWPGFKYYWLPLRM